MSARNSQQLGNSLLGFRKEAGFSQAQLGEKAGLKQPLVSAIELGAERTQLATLFKLLSALGLEIVIRKRSG